MADDVCPDCGAPNLRSEHTYEHCVARLVRQRDASRAELSAHKARIDELVKEMKARETSARVNADRTDDVRIFSFWAHDADVWTEASGLVEKIKETGNGG